MKKEETDLLKRCGTENPFTVPEGYFANFTEQLMDKLPEREIQPAPVTNATLLPFIVSIVSISNNVIYNSNAKVMWKK